MEIELLKLICPNCDSKIQSLKNDNLHFCSNCGKGYYIKDGNFNEIKTVFVKENLSFNLRKIHLPFWYVKTIIDFEGKGLSEVLNIIRFLFEENIDIVLKKEEIGNISSKEMEFIIPAFGTTNRYLLLDNIGIFYTLNWFKYNRDKPSNMLGGKYTIEDIIPILKSHFFSLSKKPELWIEKKISFNIMDKMILGIPFFVDGKMLIDGIYSKKIFIDAVADIEEIISKNIT